MSKRIVFEWDGGHPALDFVNTLDERLSDSPIERLVDYAALVSFTHQSGLFGRSTASLLARRERGPASAKVLSGAIAFREAAYRVLVAASSHTRPSLADASVVNSALASSLAHRRLIISASGASLAWDDMEHVKRPIWELAWSFEDLLIRSPFGRVRKCHASDCGVVFIDLSKAGRRRWCSMTNCGNRSKVRQFRTRSAHLR